MYTKQTTAFLESQCTNKDDDTVTQFGPRKNSPVL